MIPYSRQDIGDDDIAAVIDVLRSDWLTTGPKVGEFEQAFAEYVGAKHAVAVNSGTAALHAAVVALGVGEGDEVIVPANTFAATANAVVYAGGRPVFADIEPDTYLMDAADVARKITPQTRGIIPVDFGGQPCDYAALQALADQHDLFLHADACHALGAVCQGRKAGVLAQTSSFSFHPVKPITTAEGGMITTDDAELAATMRVFRSHGIRTDARQRDASRTWEYDMEILGWNYRLSDLQCALGLAQLRRSDDFVAKRNAAADYYDQELADLGWFQTPVRRSDRTHAFHLYAGLLAKDGPVKQRDAFQSLRANGVGAHVMYRPVYQHSFYREKLGYADGLCPVAEEVYQHILTLPVSAVMTEADGQKVVSEMRKLAQA